MRARARITPTCVGAANLLSMLGLEGHSGTLAGRHIAPAHARGCMRSTASMHARTMRYIARVSLRIQLLSD